MWARRQAHEAAVHRVDAQRAAGAARPGGVDAGFAADGLDELLLGLFGRRRAVEHGSGVDDGVCRRDGGGAARPGAIVLESVDRPERWTVPASGDGVDARPLRDPATPHPVGTGRRREPRGGAGTVQT
jgi:hypothetical protein